MPDYIYGVGVIIFFLVVNFGLYKYRKSLKKESGPFYSLFDQNGNLITLPRYVGAVPAHKKLHKSNDILNAMVFGNIEGSMEKYAKKQGLNSAEEYLAIQQGLTEEEFIYNKTGLSVEEYYAQKNHMTVEEYRATKDTGISIEEYRAKKYASMNNNNTSNHSISKTSHQTYTPFCPNCGTRLQEGTKFCSNCGTKILNGGRI